MAHLPKISSYAQPATHCTPELSSPRKLGLRSPGSPRKLGLRSPGGEHVLLGARRTDGLWRRGSRMEMFVVAKLLRERGGEGGRGCALSSTVRKYAGCSCEGIGAGCFGMRFCFGGTGDRALRVYLSGRSRCMRVSVRETRALGAFLALGHPLYPDKRSLLVCVLLF